MSLLRRPLLTLACLGALVACGDDDPAPSDAGLPDATVADAAMPDAFVPEGPQGSVLGVAESERWPIEGLSEEVYVLRTEAGVPHVYAQNERDLRIIQGFVVARDRYFQIEAGRRLAQGRLAELIGDGALSGDLGSRGRGMTKIAERLATLLTPEQQEVVDAYVLGVNAYIQAVKDGEADPPTELRTLSLLLGVNPGDMMEPLEREDLIAFAAVPIFQLGFETGDPVYGDIEERIGELFPSDELRRNGVRDDFFAPVAPINSVSSAPGFGLDEGPAPMAQRFVRNKGLSGLRGDARIERSMMDRLLARNDSFEDAFRGGRWNDFGSNAWATQPALGDGAATLSGDGHLPLSIAPFFYQMGLDTEVFGEGDNPTTLMGLFFAAIPPMAVGTNGRIAWSQTYLRGDVTDWYAEELNLEGGRPVSSVFRGEDRPLVVISESVEVGSALDSVARTETWDRYETFDGRIIAAIEGTPAEIDTEPPAGSVLVNVQGDFIIPGDVNMDGVVSAVSFDYTGFDVSNILRALQGFNDSNTVYEFHQATREMVTYAQNLVAADVDGNVYYGSYNAMPSRAHLPREEDGSFSPGANPRGLIDGTEHGGFEVRLDENGMPDESACGEAPQACLVPFERWPTSINPAEGFVLTANNDIANITTDGDFTNDEFYIGGPWNNGFRGESIRARLAQLGADEAVTLATMQQLQGDHTSVMGQLFAPFLLETIEEAQRIAGAGATGDDETRFLGIYTPEQAAIDEVEGRLQAWLDRGAEAASGVETFYNTPLGDNEVDDSVATMIFNQWWRELIAATLSDEDVDFVFAPDRRTMVTRAMLRMWRGRGADNPEGLASWNDATDESMFFDVVGTAAVERSGEIALSALVTTLNKLRAEGDDENPGVGGFGTTDMAQWRWGMRHMVKFESIIADFVGTGGAFGTVARGFSITPDRLELMEDLPRNDPRSSLPWFPRPGDLFNVDAAHTSFSPDADYFYGNGPVMRMVIRLEEGNITGHNVLPGGQSGLSTSDHFDDQAALWLANETVPLRFELEDVVEGAVTRETYAPR